MGNDLEHEDVPEVIGGLSVLDLASDSRTATGVLWPIAFLALTVVLSDFRPFLSPSDLGPVGGFPGMELPTVALSDLEESSASPEPEGTDSDAMTAGAVISS